MQEASVYCRDMTIEDVPYVIQSGVCKYGQVNHADFGLYFDYEGTKEYFSFLATNDSAIKVIAKDKDGLIMGAIIGVVTPWMHDIRQSILTAISFFSKESKAADQLLKAFELRAKIKGVSFIALSSHDRHKVFERFYGKYGFKPYAHRYMKKVA